MSNNYIYDLSMEKVKIGDRDFVRIGDEVYNLRQLIAKADKALDCYSLPFNTADEEKELVKEAETFVRAARLLMDKSEKESRKPGTGAMPPSSQGKKNRQRKERHGGLQSLGK